MTTETEIENNGVARRRTLTINSGPRDATTRSGPTAEQYVEVAAKALYATAEIAKAVGGVAAATSASQIEAQKTMQDAFNSHSDVLLECARTVETDAARLRIAEIELEREKEKTRQGETAAKTNEDNNFFWTKTLGIVAGCAALCVVIVGGPQALKSFVRDVI